MTQRNPNWGGEPLTLPPDMLHVEGDTMWIGKDYERATVIFTRQPQYDDVVRIIHIDRADPQQRRCTTFLPLSTIAAWFTAPLEQERTQP